MQKKLPTINIKGSEYTLVKDRVLEFNRLYPNGCIKTEQLESTDRVEFKATVTPDVKNPVRFFTGHSQAVWGEGMVNKTSALENAETSAVGRALALMGIGVIDSIASADELKKAETNYDPSLEKAPFCSLCGQEGIKAKTPQGRVFWSCPYWKSHKDAGEKVEMIHKPEVSEGDKKFGDSLPA